MIFAKGSLVKDFDGDGKFDKVFIHQKTKTIVYLLSTIDYKKISSLPFTELSDDAWLEATRHGFKFENRIGNVQYSSYFKYNKKEKNMELVSLKSKALTKGDVLVQGESFYKYSTKEFIGKWISFNPKLNKSMEMPILKTQVDMPTIFLNSFNDECLNHFSHKSRFYYEEEVSKLIY